jgi:hypothetical protein
MKRMLTGTLMLACACASIALIALLPATASAQGAAPTLIPGVPVITAPAALPTLDPTQFLTNGTPEPPAGSPGGGNPSPQPPANPIQQIIRYFFQIFFPANTFREAIEGAARAIFEGTVEELRDPLTVVLDVAIFENGAVFGNVALPGELSAVADIMTRAAVPLWALSLALMALSVLTRQAVGMGYGSNEVAVEAVRWFFIALASGNGFVLVSFVHAGFGLLAREIAGLNSVSAGAMVDALLRGAVDTPIIILIIMVFIAIITIFVVIITYVARYAITLAIAALAPVAIACEGIPYLRFVCRDWLSMFLRVELLQIVNLCVLVLFGHMMLFGGADGLVGSILRMVAMVGLASALIGINTAVFKQVFGVAIEAAQQMRFAVEQLVGGMAAVAGMALTGSPAPMLGIARPSDANPRTGQEPALLGSGAADDSTSALRVPSNFGGAQQSSGSNATGTDVEKDKTNASSPTRAQYRLGQAGAASSVSSTSPARQQTQNVQEPQQEAGKVPDPEKSGSQNGAPGNRCTNANMGDGRLDGNKSDVQSSHSAQQPKAVVEGDQPAQTNTSQRRATQTTSVAQADERSIPATSATSENGARQPQDTANSVSNGHEREPVAPLETGNQDEASPASAVAETSQADQQSLNERFGDSPSRSSASTGEWQPARIMEPQLPTRRDDPSVASQAGVIARTVSRATRLGGVAGAALRGFGEGTSAGDQFQQHMPADTAGLLFSDRSVPDELMQARGERFARFTLGTDSPDDASFIADQLTHPPVGASVNQMRQAYEAVAPVARDMARQYGSPVRAAAQGGYGSYGEMATALATERLRAQGQMPASSIAGATVPPGPVETWTSSSPGQTQSMTPYDYGVGIMVSARLGAQPATAPEWARTVQSLRQADGDHATAGAVLNRFVGQVEAGQFSNEREAMRWLETQVQQRPLSSGQQIDLWWRSGGSTPAYASSAGASQNDTGASQAERFARFTLGAETPGDIHAITTQISNATGEQGSYNPVQMREAYEAIAPLARDMSRQYGSTTRAAAIGGFDSYGQLVTAMAKEQLHMSGATPQIATAEPSASAGPIEMWTASPPGQGTTSQSMTPYDYGMGAFVAGQLGASAGARPEWARTLYSLRQAYGDHSMGETVFSDFIQRVGNKQFENEREARAWLEQQVEMRAPTSGRNVHLWWRASTKASDLPVARGSRARKAQGGDA